MKPYYIAMLQAAVAGICFGIWQSNAYAALFMYLFVLAMKHAPVPFNYKG